MPGIVKVKVIEGRNLPVMDRSGDTTDAYVELKMGSTAHKTEVCRKTLNPQWNSEWFRFEVDDCELQDEPLQLRLMDYDTYSANDMIGKIYFNLNPLLLNAYGDKHFNLGKSDIPTIGSGYISGWFPVHDTIHGLRGDIYVVIKLELFSDTNKYRQSSCGVQLFFSSIIPHTYHTETIFGFVEELVVEDDPEYQWIEKIRTPRASNEARQATFYKMSGELQRKIGVKVIEMGGNAIIGYRQCFDIEGESGGVVVRGVGTAVRLIKAVNRTDDFGVIPFVRSNESTESIADSTCFDSFLSEYGHDTTASSDDSSSRYTSAEILLHNNRRSRKHKTFGSRFFSLMRYFPSTSSKKRKYKFRSSTATSGSGSFSLRASDRSSNDGSFDMSFSSRNDDEALKVTGNGKEYPRLEEKLPAAGRKYPRRKLLSIGEDDHVEMESKEEECREPNTADTYSLLSEYEQDCLIDRVETEILCNLTRVDGNAELTELNLTTSANKLLSTEMECVQSRRSLSCRPFTPPLSEMEPYNIPSPSSAASETFDNWPINTGSLNNISDNKSKRDKPLFFSTPELNSIPPAIDCKPTVILGLPCTEQGSTHDFYTVDSRSEEWPTKDENIDGTSSGTPRIVVSSYDLFSSDMIIREQNSNSIENLSWSDLSVTRSDICGGANSLVRHRIKRFKSCDDILNSRVERIDRYKKNIEEPEHFNSLSEKRRQRLKKQRSVSVDCIFECDNGDRTVATALISGNEERVNAIRNKLSNGTGPNDSVTNGTNGSNAQNGDYVTRLTPPLSEMLPFVESSTTTTIREEFPLLQAVVSVQITGDGKCGAENFIKEDFRNNVFLLSALCRCDLLNPDARDSRANNSALRKTEQLYDTNNSYCTARVSRKSFSAANIFPKLLFPFANYNSCRTFVQSAPLINSNPDFFSPIKRNRASLHGGSIDETYTRNYNDKLNRFKNHNDSISNGSCLEEARKTDENDVVDSSEDRKRFDTTKRKKKLSLITTAGIYAANKLCGALTPSLLFTHANNSDRNVGIGGAPEDESIHQVARRSQSDSADKPVTADDTHNIDTSASAVSDPNVLCKDVSIPNTPKRRNNVPKYNILYKDQLETMEYPFLTLSKYPSDFILHIGGTVSARSVKLLGRISNVEEPETRDAWWTELRIEVKSHMKALACNVVLNYTENTSICDEVCVLNACGTAAVVKVYNRNMTEWCCLATDYACNTGMKRNNSTDIIETPKLKSSSTMNVCNGCNDSPFHTRNIPTVCSIYHVPYKKSSLPFPVKMKNCYVCQKASVPDMLFATIEPLESMPIIGQGAFIHAFVYRMKKDCKSETNAREISDGLPFLEYELNKQLVNKLRIKGMNSLFGLNIQISIGEKMISAYATATGIYLSPLPPPPEPSLVISKSWGIYSNQSKLAEAQKKLQETIKRNKIHYQLAGHIDVTKKIETYELAEHHHEPDFFANLKQTCIIELDDDDDVDLICQLLDPNPQQGFIVSATENLPGSIGYQAISNIQLFAQVWRSRIPTNTPPSSFNKLFYRMVQGLYIKIHNRIPCSLNKLTFKMDIPEPDELQICVIGMAVALKESEKRDKMSFTPPEDALYLTEEEKEFDPLPIHVPKKFVKKTNHSWDNVNITSLSYIPDGTIKKYLGNLNFIFIRESMGVKETGGVNSFVHNFLVDVMSIVKSHVTGIGGNAMVGFFLNECLLITHKNQGQCLVHVGGDAVNYIHNKNTNV